MSSAKLDALEERYMKSIARGVKEKLEKTLETKQQVEIFFYSPLPDSWCLYTALSIYLLAH